MNLTRLSKILSKDVSEIKLNHILKGLIDIDLELYRNILWINKTILWDLRIDSLEYQCDSTIEKLIELFEEKFLNK